MASALLCSINALTGDRSTSSRSRTHLHLNMLKDDGFKPKIITPNDIGSLFGDNSKSNNKVPDGYDEDEDDIDYEEITAEPTPEATITPVAKVAPYSPTPRKYDSETNSMRELLALQKEMMAPPRTVAVEAVEEDDTDDSSYEVPDDDDDVEVDDYLNFDRVLDKVISSFLFPSSLLAVLPT